MKFLLVAVNAKYIHSNLAVYCLKSYAASKGYGVELVEYTINQQPGEVLRDLYEKKADVVAFSCYIWNMEFVKAVLKDYKKICPQSELWLGGPEVSYRAEALLGEMPEVRGIMTGEGEETFAKLCATYENQSVEMAGSKKMPPNYGFLSDIPGIVVRGTDGEIFVTGPAAALDFSRLPFPYGDGSVTVDKHIQNGEALWNTTMSDFDNRIIYYESSRGCPFSCAYCLSSLDKKVRFRDMELVKRELRFFLDKQVPQVKFIDRTFNINNARTMELLAFIKENDNGITNFHFEVAAELLTEEQIDILNSLRPGLVQLEIGVQSTNQETLSAVNRRTRLGELREKVAAVRKNNNVHIHLDLIAGLPKEDLDSFKNSFNEVYRMNPHQLQLGFLKVLSGAPMEQMATENEIAYQSAPPYEVLSTKWLSYADIILLKKVEELVEVYYNSGQFVYSMMYLQHFFETPFELFEELAAFYEKNCFVGMKLSRNRRYEILLEFVEQRIGTTESVRVFEELLFFDYCLREKPKGRLSLGMERQLAKQELREAYEAFGIKREEEGMRDVERFSFDPVETAERGNASGEPSYILFDYACREPMYGQAVFVVS